MAMEDYLNLINGGWCAASGGTTCENENPARRGEVLGRIRHSTEEDADCAVQAAHAAFLEWRHMPLLRVGSSLSPTTPP